MTGASSAAAPDARGAAPRAGRRAARALERLLAAAAIAVASPAMLIAAAATLASLGRPVLFAQPRAGLGGRVITVRKFRTMRDLRDEAGALLPDGARTTAVGRILRRTRLDELPQLFSVLSGDMAFVGPRPLLPETVRGFGALGRRRGAVRPGVTGWAQVSGSARLTDEDKLALDLWHIAHRGLLLDLRILVETLRVALTGDRPHAGRIAVARDWLARDGGGEP
jgi:lipopolysaccharide/colanic/teichoic acid biosynthesis glycosyltransferase